MTTSLAFHALPGIPLVAPGDDLCALLLSAVNTADLVLQDDDLLVIAQKIVSKAEGRLRQLSAVLPSTEALDWADRVDKDPRLVQLILDESRRVLRHRTGLLVVEHRLGYVHANAGIDASNLEDPDSVLLLPEDPDLSARRLHEQLGAGSAGRHVNIAIIDSAGRAWRNGICGFTLGSAGFVVLEDRVGEPDLFGRALQHTEVAVADELVGAASHLMGQAAEGVAAVLVRGANLQRGSNGSESLLRDPAMDLFR